MSNHDTNDLPCPARDASQHCRIDDDRANPNADIASTEHTILEIERLRAEVNRLVVETARLKSEAATVVRESQFQARRRILRVPAVCDRVGMSRSVVYVMIKAGTFPRPVPLNDKSVGWIESEIDDWILSRVAARDAQAMAL